MTPTSGSTFPVGDADRGGTDEIAWLVINLDRAPDRFDAMARRCGALGLEVTRVPASDGRLLPASLPGVDAALYRETHGRALRPDEVGCFVSHLRALRLFLSSPHRFAMVLEDDAHLTADAVRLARSLAADGAPDDWDLVKFESHHGRFGLTVRRLSEPYRLCALPFKAAGSAAYLINRAAAERLLARMLPMRYPYDIAFDRSGVWGVRVRAILPLPVATADEPSTISRNAGTPDRRRQRLSARLGTRLTRLTIAFRAWCFPTRRFGAAHGADGGQGRALADAMEAELARLSAAHGSRGQTGS